MEKTEQIKKRRKLLMVMPLLILPFVTLAFWALGGGHASIATSATQQAGINNNLPKAKLKASPLDKMSLYAQADHDSETLKNEWGNFSYPSSSQSSDYNLIDTGVANKLNNIKNNGLQYGLEQDPNEFKVQQKLSALRSAIDHSQTTQQNQLSDMSSVNTIDPATYGLQPSEQNLDKYKELLSTAQDNGNDSDMQQINTMLDKIVSIQHPEKLEEELKTQSAKNRGQVFSIERPQENLSASVLNASLNSLSNSNAIPTATNQMKANAFYDIETTSHTEDDMHLTIPAVVAETQTLVSGASIKMRLTEDIYINGTLIPKNNFVYGVCTVSGERLKISVQSIRYHNQLFPVNLSGYDLDAIEGIRIPDAISRDASKEGADRAIQSVQMMSLDPNITTQAAAAGIEATKSLLSKKVKLIRVTVKADYPLLLLDAKGMQQEKQ